MQGNVNGQHRPTVPPQSVPLAMEPVATPDPLPVQEPEPTPEPLRVASPDALSIAMPDMAPGINEMDRHVINDETPVALKFAFVGTGQAGCRLVKMFHDLGYRRTILFNTTMQDIEGLNAPAEMVYKLDLEGVSGAGKDMSKGRKAIDAVKEDVFKFFKQRFGDGVERIIICFGAGGGTGGGTMTTLINLAKAYLMDQGIKDVDKRVGVIMSLPSRSEGAIVNQNAYEVGQRLCNAATKHEISPLLIIDNERIRKLYAKIPISKFWTMTNQTVVQLFNIFAYMSSRSSQYSTFDVEDYQSILSSGIITCGMSQVQEYKAGIDLPKLFRENLVNNLFAVGVDFETVTHAAAILAADKRNLETIPQDVVEDTFEGLNSLFGKRKGVMIHRGIYESTTPGLRMFTIVGGFAVPQARLDEIFRLGGDNS